mmetsp:Transcript_9603/g.30360  ORF Transcript_9603/g.30360 Transcript_9603/m.30360 type:complete len:303 (+) Transcript_9603:514-1422(+)
MTSASSRYGGPSLDSEMTLTLVKNGEDVELQNISRAAEQAADIWVGSSKVAMHELLDIRAGLRHQVEHEVVAVEQLGAHAVHGARPREQRPPVQHADRSPLLEQHLARAVEFVRHLARAHSPREPHDAPVRLAVLRLALAHEVANAARRHDAQLAHLHVLGGEVDRGLKLGERRAHRRTRLEARRLLHLDDEWTAAAEHAHVDVLTPGAMEDSGARGVRGLQHGLQLLLHGGDAALLVVQPPWRLRHLARVLVVTAADADGRVGRAQRRAARRDAGGRRAKAGALKARAAVGLGKCLENRAH